MADSERDYYNDDDMLVHSNDVCTVKCVTISFRLFKSTFCIKISTLSALLISLNVIACEYVFERYTERSGRARMLMHRKETNG